MGYLLYSGYFFCLLTSYFPFKSGPHGDQWYHLQQDIQTVNIQLVHGSVLTFPILLPLKSLGLHPPIAALSPQMLSKQQQHFVHYTNTKYGSLQL